ncbi:MAG: zinc-binding dehydrogenase [Candidatus Nitrosopolaris sp.]
MSKHKGSFDFILDAVSAEHDINSYIQLLRRDGNITIVAPAKPHAISPFTLIFKRNSLSGSPIGGIAETQEMLDFCGKHNITAEEFNKSEIIILPPLPLVEIPSIIKRVLAD